MTLMQRGLSACQGDEEESSEEEEDAAAAVERIAAAGGSNGSSRDGGISSGEAGPAGAGGTGKGTTAALLALLSEVAEGAAGNFEGSGVYPTISWANHSCEPNASVEFPSGGAECVLLATQVRPCVSIAIRKCGVWAECAHNDILSCE